MSLPIYAISEIDKKPENALFLQLTEAQSQLFIDVKGPQKVIRTILENMKVNALFSRFRISAHHAPLLFRAIYFGQFENPNSFIPYDLLHQTALPLILQGYLPPQSEEYACIRVGSAIQPILSKL